MNHASRRLRLALAAVWLIDASLQFQPFMFTKAFGQMLAASAQGNPPVIADPIAWSARLVGHYPVAANAAFATIQLLLAIGIAWRPAVKFALAASVAWSIAVWWLGEGLGGVLTGNATPWNGAPGAVIIYALLAVVLWPADRDASAPFVAGRPFGRLPARLLWLVLWGSLAYFALQAASTLSPEMPGMPASVTSGEQASAVLAVACELIALGIFLPAATARVAVILAVVVSAVIWVVGENFGAIFTGSATDPNSGLLLGLLATAYWPRSHRPHSSTVTATSTGLHPESESTQLRSPTPASASTTPASEAPAPKSRSGPAPAAPTRSGPCHSQLVRAAMWENRAYGTPSERDSRGAPLSGFRP